MSSREILVRFRADIGNFRRDMQQVSQSVTTAATATTTGSQQISTAMTQTQTAAAGAATAVASTTAASQSGVSSLLSTAEANSEAWGTVGASIAGAGAAILVGVGVSIAKFAEFDKQMSSVDAATHETAGNMEMLREAAIAAGADTAFSAVEAAQGIEEMAKAGVSTKDILGGGLTGALSLAAAGALGVGDAAEIAASAMTQFKLSGDQIPHVADLLAAGAGKAQGSVQDLGGALNQTGLVAAQVGLSIEETVGGLAAFASAGMTGSDAGTSFKSMLQRLTPTSKEAAKLMDELGISAYDAQGDFIGLESFAGNLQESMKDLTVEQRNAAMGTIFGSDAVRAASIIYEQGAEGVGTWISAVDEAGFAAETAARMQDNLAGDIEALGGAFDTLMIKSGEGPAEMLRGIVQAAEAAVDALGRVPAPVLSSVTAAAALVGGLALAGGAFISVVPKIAATRAALVAFNASSGVVARNMGLIGKGATAAAVGIIALGAAGSFVDKKQSDLVASSDKTTQAILAMGKGTESVDALFQSFAGKNQFVASGIDGIGSAIHRMENLNFNDKMNKLFGGLGETIKPAREQIAQIDEALAGLVSSGSADKAAEGFQKIVKAGQDSGVAAEATAGHFTKYQDSLRQQASMLKVALTDEEVYQWALGNTPPLIDAAMNSAEGQTAAAQAQAAANEETAAALAEVGLAADGTVQSLGKLLESMFAAGLAQLSANEAGIQWQESLEALDASIAKYGTSLDITTEAGKANQRALDGMAQAGISNMEAMASNGATQEELQTKLRGTYDSLVNAAGKFGLGGAEADAMARKVLGIPDDANVDTAIQNYVDTMAKLNGVKQEVEVLDGKTATVKVNYENTTTNRVINMGAENHIAEGPGGRGGMTRWTGGLVGFFNGGIVPGTPPSNPRVDNVLAMTQNGTPYGIRSGEMIINEPMTRKHLPLLQSINDGTYQAPSKSIAGGYGGGTSRSVAFSANGGGGFDSAALDRLTEAVRSARQVNINQLATSRATAMATAREMRPY